ncbi:hypothetical protein HWV00_06800 [Moritella sp. 24]|uniref:hypothetical protein n=1 Tax=Moritella sp. 24 TaxID=2746230 RepID=UPI001BAACEF7|nr:hypothetical protein [Moritella sp. 24]QUM75956.1 hypothetical protein HWV00_06800 [Moritella sp. 24]
MATIALFNSFSFRYLVFLISITLGFVVSSVVSINYDLKSIFIKSLGNIIWLSIIALVVQILVYNFFNFDFRPHDILFPFSESRVEIPTGILENMYRSGGIFIEPGTYANWTYVLLVMYILVSGDRYNVLLIVGGLSIILTASVWGLFSGIYISIFIFCAWLKSLEFSSQTSKVIFTGLTLIVLSSVFINNLNHDLFSFAEKKLLGESTSVISKHDVYNDFLIDIDQFVLSGEGFSRTFRKGKVAVQDAGLLVNFAIVFGLVFTGLFMALLIYICLKKGRYFELILSAPILLSKLFYWDFTFWLWFFLMLTSFTGQVADQKNINYSNSPS